MDHAGQSESCIRHLVNWEKSLRMKLWNLFKLSVVVLVTYISWFLVFPPLFLYLQCPPVSAITFCVSDVTAVLVFCLLITSCFKGWGFLFCFYYSFISDFWTFLFSPVLRRFTCVLFCNQAAVYIEWYVPPCLSLLSCASCAPFVNFLTLNLSNKMLHLCSICLAL